MHGNDTTATQLGSLGRRLGIILPGHPLQAARRSTYTTWATEIRARGGTAVLTAAPGKHRGRRALGGAILACLARAVIGAASGTTGDVQVTISDPAARRPVTTTIKARRAGDATVYVHLFNALPGPPAEL